MLMEESAEVGFAEKLVFKQRLEDEGGNHLWGRIFKV